MVTKIIESLKDLLGNGRGTALLSLFTPPQAADRSASVRVVMAGGALALFAVGLFTAAAAAALLLLSIGVMYYLMTQVLGVKLDFDPRLFVQQTQRHGTAASAPN